MSGIIREKRICAVHNPMLTPELDNKYFWTESDHWEYKYFKIINAETYIGFSSKSKKIQKLKHKYGFDVKIYPLNFISRRFSFFFVNFRVLKEIAKYDVVYIVGYYSSLFLFLFPICKLMGKKIITQYVGGGEISSRANTKKNIFVFIQRNILKFFLKKCDLVITYPEKEFIKIKKIYKTPKAFFVLQPVDTNFFRPMTKNKNKKLIFGYVGRFPIPRGECYTEKDLKSLIDFFSEVSVKINSELILVGSGPGRDFLDTYIKEKGMEDKIKVLRRKNHQELLKFYSSIDFLFMPFRFSKLDWGQVVMEAASCGIPVIGFKWDSESKTEQEIGFLIDFDLKKGTKQILDRINRNYMSKKSIEVREFVVKNHSFEVIQAKIRKLIEENVGITY